MTDRRHRFSHPRKFARKALQSTLLTLLLTGGVSAQLVTATSPAIFPSTAIGSAGVPQTLLLTTTVAVTISSITVPASQGNKQEYTLGTVSGCVVDGSTVNPAGTVCRVPVTFTPAYPGLRPQPLQVVTNAGNINFGMNGLATGPLASLSPGIINSYAGSAYQSNQPPMGNVGDGGPALQAKIFTPLYVAVDGSGNVYFVETSGCTVRKVTAATGIISTVAGVLSDSARAQCYGNTSMSGNGGPATSATLSYPQGIVLDSARNLYIVDPNNFIIRKVNGATGMITTYAGNGSVGYPGYGPIGTYGDGGPALSAAIGTVDKLAVDAQDNLYLTTSSPHRVRKIASATGIITTVAGVGTNGSSGDGGLATSAQVAPVSIAVDAAGNLFLSDSYNNTIRRVDATTNIITTVAGNGTSNYSGDGGSALNAGLGGLGDLALDSAGNLYLISDTAVRKVEAASGTVTTIVGGYRTNLTPYSGDGGLAVSAKIDVNNLALDSYGNLFVADSFNNIVKVIPNSGTTLTYPTVTTVGVSDTADNPQVAFLTNVGNAPLTFTLPLSGANPALSPAWSLNGSSSCPSLSSGSASFSVATGGSCSLAVDFKPTAAGTNSGSLVVTDNSLNVTTSTQTVLLTGVGKAVPGPALSLTPSSLTFPDTQVGGASASQTITVTNSGSATAASVGIGITGAAPASFTQTNNCGTSLAASSTCVITVTFVPKAVSSALNATLSAASTDPNSPASATLSGRGLSAGSLSISPTAQMFPQTTLGATSNTQTSTISNTTANAVYLSGGSLTDATDFTQTDNCNGLLIAGGTCTVTFVFTPKSAGSLSSTYAIHDLNNPSAPLMVTLSGNGLGSPAAVFNPTSLTFTTSAGSTAANQSTTLSNSGTAALTISSLALTGTNASSFAIVSNTCGTSLLAGSSCIITVSFGSSTVGSYSAILTAVDNAASGSQSVALTGSVSGVPSAILTPSTLSFNTAPGTTSATQTATLSNPGTGSLPITSIALNGANATSFHIVSNACGTTLAPGASCTIAVAFMPTAAGSFSSVLTLTDGVGTQTSALAGTSVAPVPPDFTVTPSPVSQNTYRGRSVSYTLQLSSLLATNPFTSAITLAASNLPAGATVSFSPATVAPGATPVSSVMTVNVPALQSQSTGHESVFLASISLGSAFLMLVTFQRRRRPVTVYLALLLVLGGATLGMSGCGTGNGFGIPTSTTNITVTATSGTTVHSTFVSLTVQ